MNEKKYICSVCKERLSLKEVERYFKEHRNLELNWGQCNGKEAYPVLVER